MHLHEYQAKELLKSYHIPICEGFLISDVSELSSELLKRGWDTCVLKAQIHAGARGKAGGVRLASSIDEAVEHARKMLGYRFVTEQTGPLGKIAHQLLVCPTSDIQRELYIGMTYDREAACVRLIASGKGGIHIESSTHSGDASQSCQIRIDERGRIRNYQKWLIAKTLQIPPSLREEFFMLLSGLCQLFFDTDATLVEINPLALTKTNQLIALDAKISIDDNSLFRQSVFASWSDPKQYSPQEALAQKEGLSYVGMDGNIGCMVNGAGLAMATMDLLALYGGRAANFLDVGGSADQERIATGFEILASEPRVDILFVHIFGGIMDCSTVAKGVILGCSRTKRQLPIVLRMEGTNVDQARALLEQSKLDIKVATSLEQAAELCVRSAHAHTNHRVEVRNGDLG